MFKKSQAHCIFIYPCHKIGATLGPQLCYFGDGKRSHDYGHFTVALINNTACIDIFWGVTNTMYLHTFVTFVNF